MVDELALHVLVNLQASAASGPGLQHVLRRLPALHSLTLSPRSMNLTATSSLDCRSRMSLATPKLPLPMSRICAGEHRESAPCAAECGLSRTGHSRHCRLRMLADAGSAGSSVAVLRH